MGVGGSSKEKSPSASSTDDGFDGAAGPAEAPGRRTRRGPRPGPRAPTAGSARSRRSRRRRSRRPWASSVGGGAGAGLVELRGAHEGRLLARRLDRGGGGATALKSGMASMAMVRSTASVARRTTSAPCARDGRWRRPGRTWSSGAPSRTSVRFGVLGRVFRRAAELGRAVEDEAVSRTSSTGRGLDGGFALGRHALYLAPAGAGGSVFAIPALARALALGRRGSAVGTRGPKSGGPSRTSVRFSLGGGGGGASSTTPPKSPGPSRRSVRVSAP